MRSAVVFCLLFGAGCSKDEPAIFDAEAPDVAIGDSSMETDSSIADLSMADVGADAALPPDMAVEPPCGNGALDEGEACDPAIADGAGACPASCDDGNACTSEVVSGDAMTCSAECVFTPICVDGDGCCGAGCDLSNDAECFVSDGSTVASIGWVGNGNVYGAQVVAAANGVVYVAGNAEGTFSINGTSMTSPGQGSGWVVALDPAGTVLWSKVLGSTSSDTLVAMSHDPMKERLVIGLRSRGTTFDAGELTETLTADGTLDLVVLELDTSNSGATQWIRSFGNDQNNLSLSLVASPDGTTWIGGGFAGTLDFGAGPVTAVATDAFLLQVDGAGITGPARIFSSPGNNAVLALDLFEDGGVFAAGRLSGSIDFGGGERSGGGSGMFALRLDATGTHVWSTAVVGRINVGDAAILPRGDVALVGGYLDDIDFGTGLVGHAGASDGFVVVLAGDTGAATQAASFGGPGNEWVLSVAATVGGVNIGGYYEAGAVDFDDNALAAPTARDAFIARFALSPSDQPSWFRTFGGSGGDEISGVSVDAGFAVHAVGTYSGPVDFGLGALPDAPSSGAVYVVLAP